MTVSDHLRSPGAFVLAGIGLGAIAAAALPLACSVGATAQCLQHWFEYNLVLGAGNEVECTDANAGLHHIDFTGPLGYDGRFCTEHQQSAKDVVTVIDFLRGGGVLSEVPAATRNNYLAIVDEVRGVIKADCINAAPSLCVDESAACEGVSLDARTALVTNQTCTLSAAGTESFDPGSYACAYQPIFQGFATGPGEEPCTGSTGGTGVLQDGDGLDEGSSTGAPADPFGDLGTLVSCSDTCSGAPECWRCDADTELVVNIEAWFSVFYDEGVTLEIVDSGTLCGPGVRIGGFAWGEASYDLAGAFHLEAGDVITKANGTTLSTMARAVSVIDDLLEDHSTLDLIVKRRNDTACDTITVDINVN